MMRMVVEAFQDVTAIIQVYRTDEQAAKGGESMENYRTIMRSLFLVMISVVLIGFGESFAALGDLETRWVNAGSWYVTGFEWPHDGRPFESEHFIIYSDGASEEARQEVARFAEDALVRIKLLLQIENEEIFLYPRGQNKIHIYAYKHYFPLDWGGWGYYGGLLIYSLDHLGRQGFGHTKPQVYFATLTHEIMHVVESLLKGSNDPRLMDVWFTEGIAEVLAGGTAGGPVSDFDKMTKLQEQYGSWNPIAMHSYDYPDIPNIAFYYYYPMFQLAVQYLIDDNGLGRTPSDLRDLIIDVRNGIQFQTAFYNRTKMTLEEFETRFFRLMKSYFDTTAADVCLSRMSEIFDVYIASIKWAGMQYRLSLSYRPSGPVSEPAAWFEIIELQPAGATICSTHATLSQEGGTFILHASRVEFRGSAFWADFEYVPSTDDRIWMKLLAAGPLTE